MTTISEDAAAAPPAYEASASQGTAKAKKVRMKNSHSDATEIAAARPVKHTPLRQKRDAVLRRWLVELDVL